MSSKLPDHTKSLVKQQWLQTVAIPNSGHWIPEEQPVILVKLLNNFFGGAKAKK